MNIDFTCIPRHLAGGEKQGDPGLLVNPGTIAWSTEQQGIDVNYAPLHAARCTELQFDRNETQQILVPG